MNEKILQLITEYGLEAVVIALAINLFVGLLKLPIKAWASKMRDGTNLTRYLVFLPVMVGLLLTLLYAEIVYETVDINRQFVTLWASSSSLSLAFYAFWEKLFPTKASILKNYEIEENKRVLSQIKAILNAFLEEDVRLEIAKAETNNDEREELSIKGKNELLDNVRKEKIVLRRNRNVETSIKGKSV